ncbi:MAG: aldo/keto reductase [bacterium]|nr:aldo/keto reductase [bacterium]
MKKKGNSKENNIPMRPLGKTGLKATVLGFGGIPISQVTVADAVAVVRRAAELGINFFDTARAYSDSETKIGFALKEVREKCIIATKGTAKTKAEMEQTLATSLKELRTDYIDIYQCHNIQNREFLKRILSPDGAITALKEAKKKGIIRHIGLTSHSVPVLIEAIESSDVFETILVPYNYVETDIVDKLLPLANKRGLAVIAMKPFGGSAFADNPRRAMKFVLDQPVSVALVGMETVAEVEENVQISKRLGKLIPLEKKKIAQLGRELVQNFCRRCGYCQPCSVGIEISYVLGAKLIYKRYGWKNYINGNDNPKLARVAECIHCRLCIDRCPYHLPIPDLLPGRVQELNRIYAESFAKENRLTSQRRI